MSPSRTTNGKTELRYGLTVPKDNWDAIAQTSLCMKDGKCLSAFLERTIIAQIPLYFCVQRKRKYSNHTAANAELSPTFDSVYHLLTQGRPPAHITADDPDPRLFADTTEVWAWTLHRVQKIIKDARFEAGINCPAREVRDDAPAFARSYSSGKGMWAVCYRLLTTINKEMDTNGSSRHRYRRFHLSRANNAWIVILCDGYEAGKLVATNQYST